MGQATGKQKYIDRKLDELFRRWYVRAGLCGAGVFAVLIVLDYVSTPENFRLFLAYRACIILLLISASLLGIRYAKAPPLFHHAVVYAMVVAVAVTVELMILRLGGHASPYYTGQVLVGIYTVWFTNARMPHPLLYALLIYLVYLVPILALDDITAPRDFLTANVFLLMIFGSAVLIKHLYERTLVTEFGLEYDLERNQKRLEQSLADKDVLMREIHHRAKNNLAVISSLLGIQSSRMEDEKSREVFRESQRRVRSMSLIHERLYRSGDMKGLGLSEYIRDLAADLFRTYNVSSSRVRLVTDIPDVALDVDTIIPCGLIVNELISNSLKHAFPAGREGELKLTLERAGEDEYLLVVKDDGRGLPDEFDVNRTGTMGMSIVTSLTNQLNGSIEVGGGPGAEFRVLFRERTPDDRDSYGIPGKEQLRP
jgi:two-component sensor histidine kinase